MTDWKVENIATLANGKKASEISSAGRYPIYGGNGIMGYSSVMNAENVVIVGRVGAYCGSVHYSPTECWISDNAISAYAKPGNSLKYLYYLLKFLDLNKHHIGGAQPLMTQGIINNINIPRHTLEEQKKIASILSTLDEKIETNRKINARLEELAQALFKSWFIDFEPFGGSIPNDWTFKHVSEFPHEIETGKRPKGGVSGITEGIPSIGAESIKGIGYYDYSKTKYIPYEYAKTMKKGRIQDFDLLIYKDGGKPGYFIPDFSMMGMGFPFKDMFLNEHVFRLNFGKPELNIFAYFFVKTDEVMNYLNSVGGKAAIPGINQRNVEDIEILDLNNPQIIKFGAIAYPMFKTILENCNESARLAELRDTLLPKLMSGEIKIEQSPL